MVEITTGTQIRADGLRYPTGTGPDTWDDPADFEVYTDAAIANALGLASSTAAGTWLHRPPLWKDRWEELAAAAASRTVVVDFWGDSTTFGVSPVTNTTAFVTLTEAALQAAYGDGGSGYRPLSRSGTISGFTSSGGVLGGCIHQATSAASWEDTIDGTEFAIIFDNFGVTGSFRYRVDGGAWTTITTPYIFGLNPANVLVTGLSNGTHTVRIEWVSGTVRIAGVDARRSTGVACRMFATGGVRARDYARHPQRHGTASWTTTSTTITATGNFRFDKSDIGLYIDTTEDGIPRATAQITAVADNGTTATIAVNTTAGDSGAITLCVNPGTAQDKPSDTLAPRSGDGFGRHGLGTADLCIISLGLNDMESASSQSNADMCRAGIASIMHGYQLWGLTPPLFAFLIQNKGLARDNPFADLVAAQRDMAAAVDAAVIDMWQWARHHPSDVAAYWGDGLHPDVSGNQLIAELLGELLVA